MKEFQQGAGLVVDGIVGPLTWDALPDGGPMPTLQEGDSSDVVRSLQTVLTNGAPGDWGTTPQGIDGYFGPHTKASVEAFQSSQGLGVDGIVGPQTWPKLIIQVHDEVVLNCPKKEAEEVRKLVTKVMENAMELSVPLAVNSAVGKNWMEI